MRESNSSSPRIASCKWRGVIRFTFKSFDAFPANSSTYKAKTHQFSPNGSFKAKIQSRTHLHEHIHLAIVSLLSPSLPECQNGLSYKGGTQFYFQEQLQLSRIPSWPPAPSSVSRGSSQPLGPGSFLASLSSFPLATYRFPPQPTIPRL